MKIRVNITVDLDEDHVAVLKQIAEMSGHNFDKANTREVIRRYLESRVTDAVIYCHEQLSKD